MVRWDWWLADVILLRHAHLLTCFLAISRSTTGKVQSGPWLPNARITTVAELPPVRSCSRYLLA